MKHLLITALAAVGIGGCASPFDDRWYADGSDALPHDELPRWVNDDWNRQSSEAHNHGREAERRNTRNVMRQNLDDAPGETELGDLIVWALDHSPTVRAAEARWHAARQRIAQATTLPDPELSYRMAIDQIDTQQSPIGHAIGLSQRFPWFGTLDIAGDVQAAHARVAAEQYVQAQLQVVAAVKHAWAEYAYLHATVDVLGEQLELLMQLGSVIRSRYRTGEATQTQLTRMEGEIDRVRSDLANAQQMLPAARAQLNAASGRPIDQQLQGSPSLPEHVIKLNESQLLQLLSVANPALNITRQQIAAQRHTTYLAEQQFYPQLMIGFEYGIGTGRRMARNERRAGLSDVGQDTFAARVGLTLPLWHESYASGVREAMAEWAATLRQLDQQELTLQSDMKMSLYRLSDAQRRMELFGTMLRTRAEQVFVSTQAAYRVNEASFTDLIDAQREMLEFAIAHERAVADQFQQLARIEVLVGQTISQLNSGEAIGTAADHEEQSP